MTLADGIADHLWPRLSERFGLHPRDWRLTPEDGGLTWGQWKAYLEAVNESSPFPVGVYPVNPRGR